MDCDIVPGHESKWRDVTYFCAGLPELGWPLFDVAHEESLDVPWILGDQPDDDAAIQAPE